MDLGVLDFPNIDTTQGRANLIHQLVASKSLTGINEGMTINPLIAVILDCMALMTVSQIGWKNPLMKNIEKD